MSYIAPQGIVLPALLAGILARGMTRRRRCAGSFCRRLSASSSRPSAMMAVPHEMRFAREAADRIIFMDGGVFVEKGPPEQFYTSPKDPRTAKFLQRLLAGEEGRGKK